MTADQLEEREQALQSRRAELRERLAATRRRMREADLAGDEEGQQEAKREGAEILLEIQVVDDELEELPELIREASGRETSAAADKLGTQLRKRAGGQRGEVNRRLDLAFAALEEAQRHLDFYAETYLPLQQTAGDYYALDRGFGLDLEPLETVEVVKIQARLRDRLAKLKKPYSEVAYHMGRVGTRHYPSPEVQALLDARRNGRPEE